MSFAGVADEHLPLLRPRGGAETEEQRTRLREVSLVVERLFAGDTAPEIEMTPQALDQLYGMVATWTSNERDAKIIAADMRQRAREYRAETQRLTEILAVVGMDLRSLSSSGKVSAQTLAATSDVLDLKDTATTSLFLGLEKLARDLYTSEKAIKSQTNKRQRKERTVKMVNQKAALLEAIIVRLEEQAAIEARQSVERDSRVAFLQQKSRHYAEQIRRLEAELTANGYQTSTTHSALQRRAQQVQDLREVGRPVEAALTRYQSLPPDLSLAGTKLEEARRELAALENSLSESTSWMLR